ncbi:sensor histidine kinase [Cellulomonas bogoriensis]|uniref:Histidine kinase n=1 Tax=Cellulomonas bogoriensis 69B4 = DSM 16987 TaxID=1386082 RepID=A0A0A0BXJ8_9CELL|nr:histidine kinase [Cellulomonas bogoriensis]KGM13123.1 histidine kinase [Cellulomonas bogoriensis 69B4 = DSM 16987]
MSVTEVRPLTRMRSITTAVVRGTVAFVGGFGLIVSAGVWWHPVVVAPSLGVAVWVAGRWHDPPRLSALIAALALAQGTWVAAVLVGIDVPAVVPVATIGAVLVATRSRSRGVWALAVVVMIVATAFLNLVSAAGSTVGYVAGALLYAGILVGTFWLNDVAWRLFTELDAMRATAAELAVVKERMRFAADLHDIQGHTLHVIKLKAAVAARLQHVDPERVAAELREIERLTGETIDQAQHLVNSTRRLAFRSELANATELLTAAGIGVDVHGEVPHHTADEEIFALVLREATTNILRHPAARTVAITIADGALTISNDGAAGTARRERGLAVLRERVARSGGVLDVSHDGDSFTLDLGLRGART